MRSCEGRAILGAMSWLRLLVLLCTAFGVGACAGPAPPPPQLRDEVASAIDFLDSGDGSGDRMVKAWRCGDDAGLAQLVLGPGGGPPEPGSPRERVFSSRNRAMADRLEALLGGGDVFVVVGAGHLLDDGIPALLAARGHRVERYPATPPLR